MKNAPAPQLTLKPMSPFLQHRQANMRKMKVKSPEKETATTASEEDQESSLRGVPSVGTRAGQGWGYRGGVLMGLMGAWAWSSQWEGGPSVSPEPRQDWHGGCIVPVAAGGQ